MSAGWTKWESAHLPPDAIADLVRLGSPLPKAIYVNNLYEVWIFGPIDVPGFPPIVHLSLKRRDKRDVRDWRHLQRIKTELVGPECEGVELLPAESRHADAANQYHLFVVTDPAYRFPFGFTGGRLVKDDGKSVGLPPGDRATARARQRPFDATHPPPDPDPAEYAVPAIAHAFATRVRLALSRDELRQVVDRNASEPAAMVCHSHDFVDSNVLMLNAFADAGLREPTNDTLNEAQVAAALALWKQAWSLAKAQQFDPNRIAVPPRPPNFTE